MTASDTITTFIWKRKFSFCTLPYVHTRKHSSTRGHANFHSFRRVVGLQRFDPFRLVVTYFISLPAINSRLETIHWALYITGFFWKCNWKSYNRSVKFPRRVHLTVCCALCSFFFKSSVLCTEDETGGKCLCNWCSAPGCYAAQQ